MINSNKRRRIQIFVITGIIILLIAGGYLYREFSRPTITTAEAQTASSHAATDLLVEFEVDTTAIAKYSGRVLEVTGTIKAFDGGAGNNVIYLGDAGQSTSIRCVMDSSSALPKDVQEGMVLTVKGTCIGYEQDPLLGTDIVMSRCIVLND